MWIVYLLLLNTVICHQITIDEPWRVYFYLKFNNYTDEMVKRKKMTDIGHQNTTRKL
jgi:hypothetical protein